jgi:hypothetical protein
MASTTSGPTRLAQLAGFAAHTQRLGRHSQVVSEMSFSDCSPAGTFRESSAEMSTAPAIHNAEERLFENTM